ncbi:solute:Na+ symporter, SSS family [Parapedobacter luteus]|uniref:Sodium/proline symporter n=1 Tax=Parapedobacter luteus TaxID=623280 RepID=A0A1T5E4S2_9SPHI|nr:sodium/proline symporter PutP [Parapedobacter luteus]SKB78874.1 solute:Na+ symporter, SSS family [Parapedobacter luteus]
MDINQLIAISTYMLLMIGIGIYSYRKSTSNVNEFLLGGRRLGPAVTALSAGASDMSGWLLMGLPGAMFATGISSGWIAIGLTIGAFLNYLLVAPALRIYTEKAGNSITIPDYFENRFHDSASVLRLISAIIILVFFTLYTSAGMVSGGRLFESAFHMDYHTGLFITSAVVVLYTFLGGFLAVSLTDFVQGTIMVLALVIIPIVLIIEVGGIGVAFETIRLKDPSYLSLFKGTTTVGIISLLAWGLGYFGQPHILVRFMAIDQVKQLRAARHIGISWMIFTVGGAMLIGLIGIAYMEQLQLSIADPETIFIYFSRVLFHPLIGGSLLSAILAAVMSTISSQLLVTSSSMTEDFYKALFRKQASEKELLLVSRLSVLVVAIVAIILSLSPKDTILDLVGHAWAGFGSAFGPLILLSLLWRGTTRNGAIAGMAVGGLTVLLWTYIDHPLKAWYSMIPGFILSFLAIVIVSKISGKPDKTIQEQFDEVQTELKAMG